jgi:hypothetical protein
MLLSKTSQRHQVLGLLGASALVFTMSACGEAGATADGSAAAATQVQGPLTQILSSVWGSDLSQEEQQRQFDERNLAEQEFIAQCMSQAGFEYIPHTGNATIVFSDDNMWRPDDREWVTQYGYGAMRSPWDTQREEEQAAIEAGGEVTTQEFVDPNSDMLNSLSDSERRAWEIALWGDWENMPDGVISEDGMILDEDAFWSSQGCNGEARLHTRTDSAFDLMSTDEFRPLMDSIQDFFDTLWALPSEADREWATCMADAGHPGFTRQNDASNSIWEAQTEFWNNMNWDNWDWETMGSPNANTHPEMGTIADREVELALTDLDCRESVNFRSRQEAAQIAAETQFVNDHRAALDALIAAAAQR